MTDFQHFAPHEQPLRDEVRQAVETGGAIREKVRLAVLKALSGRPLELPEIHGALRAALDSAAKAKPRAGTSLRDALAETVAGLDAALTHAALALQLAGAEAGGKAGAWRNGELRRLVDDLKGLETLFIETLDGAGRDAGRTGGEIFSALAGHARGHGTEAGRAAVAAVSQLRAPLRQAAGSGIRSGARLTRATGADLASIASGILAGVADALARPPGAREKSGRS